MTANDRKYLLGCMVLGRTVDSDLYDKWNPWFSFYVTVHRAAKSDALQNI
jgi:hypothetical protein